MIMSGPTFFCCLLLERWGDRSPWNITFFFKGHGVMSPVIISPAVGKAHVMSWHVFQLQFDQICTCNKECCKTSLPLLISMGDQFQMCKCSFSNLNDGHGGVEVLKSLLILHPHSAFKCEMACLCNAHFLPLWLPFSGSLPVHYPGCQ